MILKFSKYAGCGNDFVIMDNRSGSFPCSDRPLIQRICCRQHGIGADGLLLLEDSLSAVGKMRIFNADGSEAEMCGNGLRCFTHWLQTIYPNQKTFVIEVFGHLFQTTLHSKSVSIGMGTPSQLEWNIQIPTEEDIRGLLLHFLNTGVPHAVIAVEAIDTAPLCIWGPFLRYHPHWQPNGTNVTLMQRTDERELHIRTYERGVEGETLACGTGAVAAALTAAHSLQMNAPVEVVTLSKERLTVDFRFSPSPPHFSDVTLTGPTKCTFIGEFNLTP